VSVALVLPAGQYERSYREARDEQGDPLVSAFSELLARFEDNRAGRVDADRVPSTTYWLVEGSTYLGRISIRHVLSDALRVFGGHIGYDIRPSRRGQGLGTQMLRLAMPCAALLGIDPAMLTCDTENAASWRLIERCGGIRESTFSYDGTTRFRYWLPTTI
jgi:predicted acetyltransferase